MNNPLSGTDPSGYCKTRAGSRICSNDGAKITANLKDLVKITEYQKDGDSFLVGTLDNGAIFVIESISNLTTGRSGDANGPDTLNSQNSIASNKESDGNDRQRVRLPVDLRDIPPPPKSNSGFRDRYDDVEENVPGVSPYGMGILDDQKFWDVVWKAIGNTSGVMKTSNPGFIRNRGIGKKPVSDAWENRDIGSVIRTSSNGEHSYSSGNPFVAEKQMECVDTGMTAQGRRSIVGATAIVIDLIYYKDRHHIENRFNFYRQISNDRKTLLIVRESGGTVFLFDSDREPMLIAE